MDKEITGYIKTEAIVSAAFNFFINGMAAALIHHKADTVATDPISIAIDLTATCMGTCIINALFSKASVRRTKTAGILEPGSRMIRFLSRLFRRPALFGVFTGFIAAVVFFIPTALIFMLPGIMSIPFGVYILLKCVFAALIGGGITALEIYAGMCKTDS